MANILTANGILKEPTTNYPEIEKKRIKEYIESALASLTSDSGVIIPTYLTFEFSNRYIKPKIAVAIITPKIVENILSELSWERLDDKCESDNWDKVWLVFAKDNKEFIFSYNGYNLRMDFYGMHERGDES